MSDLRIAVQVAGDERAVDTGTTAGDLLDQGKGQGNGRDKAQAVVAARVNGVLRDLGHVVEEGDEVEPVILASDDGRMIMRHSTAHVLAQAVQDLFPEAKLGIGRRSKGLLLRLSSSPPSVPEDLERGSSSACVRCVKEVQRFRPRVVATTRPGRAEDEPSSGVIDQRTGPAMRAV